MHDTYSEGKNIAQLCLCKLFRYAWMFIFIYP